MALYNDPRPLYQYRGSDSHAKARRLTYEPIEGGLVPRKAIAMVRDAVTQLDPENFGFDVVEVAPQYDVSDTNSYNGDITSGFANRLIIEVMGSMALAERGATEGSPITPKESLGPQPDLEASADD